MSISIGLACDSESWQTCLMENGQILQLNSFVDALATRTYLEHICTLYPEPTIVISADLDTPLIRLVGLSAACLKDMLAKNFPSEQKESLSELLIAISYTNINSYLVPSVKFLSSVPSHRKLMREDLGSASNLCAVVALLMQLRAREAAWSEMHFMCLEVNHGYRSILVVEDGRIVNGMTSMQTEDCDQEAAQEAFWEGLTQELAGLLAVHHFEEIVVTGHLKDAFTERFADVYQVYLFPSMQPGFDDFEVALGAAVIAEGLYGHNTFAEIVERLEIRDEMTIPEMKLAQYL
ncbi:MAG TPA: DUF1464 family protein [Ktedonobacteraceae bacterium]|nr:DUF1464 family protein [Ktedonobacteraceae bacterium]